MTVMIGGRLVGEKAMPGGVPGQDWPWWSWEYQRAKASGISRSMKSANRWTLWGIRAVENEWTRPLLIFLIEASKRKERSLSNRHSFFSFNLCFMRLIRVGMNYYYVSHALV